MSDASDRPEKKAFEPPPWEAEQFEALRKKREAEEASRADAVADALEAVGGADEVREDAAEAAEEMAAPLAGRDMSVSDEDVAAAEAEAEDRSRRELDPRVVDAMLVQLQGETPDVLRPVKTASKNVAYGVAVVTAVLAVLTVVSLVLSFRTSAMVYGFGAAMLGVLTIFCGGVAAWLFVLTRR